MADTDNIVLKKGLGSLPMPNVENGSVLFETDSGRMYIDDNNVRTQISRKISSGEELPTESVKDGDIFLKTGADNGEEDAYNTLYPILNEHINDIDNPHGVTWEQVGAAPGGYGLGAACVNIQDWNNVTANGFYYAATNSPDGNRWWGYAVVNSSNYIEVRAFRSSGGAMLEVHRTLYNGTWLPWEWVNPPMQLGVEYRTTKRFNGWPVYTKAVWGGALPNTGYTMVSLSTDDGSASYAIWGYAITTTATSASSVSKTTLRDIIPWNNNSNNGVNINISSDVAIIWCSIDRSTTNCIVIFEYVKN